MTTYYVAKFGNDSNSGLSGSGAKLTIQDALDEVSNEDTVEIIDEGTYNEGDLEFTEDNLTIRHTASWLGRPVISAVGIDANDAIRAFNVAGVNTTYIGLEITGFGLDNSSGCVLHKGGGTGLEYHKFHMSGCFIHSCSILGGTSFANTDAGDPSTLKQCIMYFHPYNKVYKCIENGATGYMEISNCLITSSNVLYHLVEDYGARLTASFSTFINRTNLYNPDTDTLRSSGSIVRAGKVINCILSGSGDGIASNDHTYNLVVVETSARSTGIPYLTLGETLGTTGSGDITGDDPGFIDGTLLGERNTVAASYNLQCTSVAVDAGVGYGSISLDITGTARPLCNTFDMGCFELIPPDFCDYDTSPGPNIKDGFVMQNYMNLSSNHVFRYCNDTKTGQAPFSIGTKGPQSVRGRNTPYKTIK